MMRLHRIPAGVAAAAIVAMALAPVASASPRSGEVHITKDCTGFMGLAGQSCMITRSDLRAIPVGARIVYESAVQGATLDTDISIATGPGNVATGHCTLDFLALPGRCDLSGGTGKLTHLHLSVVVSPDPMPGIWHWDGTFSFSAGA
jgi:hypothetical protein